MVEVPDGSRAYSVTYNIASADTWEKKTITIAGDTGGTINNDNGVGITLRFTLTAGSNYQGGTEDAWASAANNMYGGGSSLHLFSSTSNDWYIAGLQVEEGSVATDFDFQDYDTTLQRCLRYFEKRINANAYAPLANSFNRSTTIAAGFYGFTEKRVGSTITLSGATEFGVTHGSSADTQTSGVTAEEATARGCRLRFTVGSGLTAGEGSLLANWNNTTAYITVSSEF